VPSAAPRCSRSVACARADRSKRSSLAPAAIMRPVTGAKVSVRVQANARRDELVGIRDGVLVVRVAAPAVDGRANRALCRVLAKRLGVAASRVTIARGQRSRDKLVQLEGADQAALDAALRA
jgi:uncharacterized protein